MRRRATACAPSSTPGIWHDRRPGTRAPRPWGLDERRRRRRSDGVTITPAAPRSCAIRLAPPSPPCQRTCRRKSNGGRRGRCSTAARMSTSRSASVIRFDSSTPAIVAPSAPSIMNRATRAVGVQRLVGLERSPHREDAAKTDGEVEASGGGEPREMAAAEPHAEPPPRHRACERLHGGATQTAPTRRHRARGDPDRSPGRRAHADDRPDPLGRRRVIAAPRRRRPIHRPVGPRLSESHGLGRPPPRDNYRAPACVL